MSMRQSHTAVVERNQCWEGDFITEPYEVGWSHEAIFFVRILRFEEDSRPRAFFDARMRVQISPDGIHWCDAPNGSVRSKYSGSGNKIDLSASKDELAFAQVSHYGGWLRLAGTVKNGRVWALVHLALKA